MELGHSRRPRGCDEQRAHVQQRVLHRDQQQVAGPHHRAVLVQQRQPLGDLLLGLDVRVEQRRTVDRLIRPDLEHLDLAVPVGVVVDHHEAFEVLARVVLGVRHERAEDHERRIVVARQPEQQVLRRDPCLHRGDHLAGGLVAHRLHRGLADRIARVLRHRPRARSVVELRGVVQAVPAPRIGLHPEQVLGIAEVLLQLTRRRVLGEQRRELPHVGLHDRITAVHHVERHRAVVRIHHGLHRVAHVVVRVAQVAAHRGRPRIRPLRVRELRGGGVRVEHPLHLPVDHHRVRVVVVGQERRQQLHPLGDVAVEQDPAVARDLARHQQVRLGEAHRERQPPEEAADAHAVGTVIASGLGAVVVVLEVDLGPLGAHDGVAP